MGGGEEGEIKRMRKEKEESGEKKEKRGRTNVVTGLLAWLQSSWIDYVVVQHFSRSVTMCFTTNGVLQVLAFLFFILCGVSVHNFDCLYMYACQLKIVTVLSWEHFQVLIFCMVIACSFPFLPLLRHYVLLPWKYSIGNNAWHT